MPSANQQHAASELQQSLAPRDLSRSPGIALADPRQQTEIDAIPHEEAVLSQHHNQGLTVMIARNARIKAHTHLPAFSPA
jgi:hypothetical protein